jgi:hypothetical protein
MSAAAGLPASYLTDVQRTYGNYRRLAESAIAQLTDEQLLQPLATDDNSIAVIMQHVSGNLQSRFRDFLTTDGEKPGRNRDAEFAERPQTRESLMTMWNAAWETVLGELERLTPEALGQTVHIRQEAFTVVEALNRSATHTAYHVGQIVFLAKHLAGPAWTSLSIPKGRSADFAQGTFKRGIVPHRG